MRDVIMWQSGLSVLTVGAESCLHHKQLLTSRFASMHMKCFDLFNNHRKNVKRGFAEITLKFAKEMMQYGFSGFIPGYKIYPSCRMTLKGQIGRYEAEGDLPGIDEEESSFDDAFDHDMSASSSKDSINISLGERDVSPLTLHSIPPHSKVIQGKRKLKQTTAAFSSKVTSALQLQRSDLLEEKEPTKSSEIVEQESNDLTHLVNLMKEKVKASTRRRKIQILTLTPESWSIRKAAKEFQVSKKTIQKAWTLKEERVLWHCLI